MSSVPETETEDRWAAPMPVDDITLAFPANISHLMPQYQSPELEALGRRSPWVTLQQDWFFNGMSEVKWEPRDGIDPQAALRHLKAIQGSFEPKHEHKEAAVAYLASRWFTKVTYTSQGKKVTVP